MLHRSKIAPKIETAINSQISLHLPIRSLLPGQHRSPPLSRGIPDTENRRVLRLRITPAFAGNTRLAASALTIRSDHPRSRGEYTGATRTGIRCAGSSSLSRGIPLTRNPKSCYGRIIPALAGNTLSWRSRTRGISDHPRSRGEYTCPPATSTP